MPKTDVKAAYTRSSEEPLRTMAMRHGTGSRVTTKKEKKQFSAGCLIPVLEGDTVYMLENQGNVGGWE